MATEQTNLAWDTLFALDGDASGPLHVRLTRAIRDAIRSGLLPAGSALPPTRQLALDISSSRWVVKEAYEQLVAEGYLEARVGSGTRVRMHGLARAAHPDGRDIDRPRVRFDLTPGLPDFKAFPRRQWTGALRDAIAAMSDSDLDYQEPGGHPRLRRVIADYLRRVRGAVVRPADVTITAGILDGISLLSRAMAASGRRRIAVEDPTWLRVVDAARIAGLEPVPVPVDGDGICADALPALDVQAVIVAPSHQFPTGAVLSPERRFALLDWARDSDGVVLEDDYDAEFRYDRRPVGTLQGIDPEHTVLLGSVSKTLAPAVGLGWMVTPRLWSGSIRSIEARLTGPSVLSQLAFARFIESGAYDRQLRVLRRSYRSRRDRFVSAVDRLLPDCRISGAAAGLHVLITLPPGVTGRAVAEGAAVAGILLKDLRDCRVGGGPGEEGIVVGYANLDDEAVDLVVGELARTVRANR